MMTSYLLVATGFGQIAEVLLLQSKVSPVVYVIFKILSKGITALQERQKLEENVAF